LISRVGRGVVVTIERGLSPRRSPNISMSQASGYRQAAQRKRGVLNPAAEHGDR
jgi:hypothetical protein